MEKEPMPQKFQDLREASDFWDTQSARNYWDESLPTDVEFYLDDTKSTQARGAIR
jgi:hypothetical protein